MPQCFTTDWVQIDFLSLNRSAFLIEFNTMRGSLPFKNDDKQQTE